MSDDGLGETMMNVLSDMPGPLLVALLSLGLGMMFVLLGYTRLGQRWPRPRAFWGLLGICVIIMGLGFFIVGLSDAMVKSTVQEPETGLFSTLGTCILLSSVLLLGIWVTWLYLVRQLYSFNVVPQSRTRLAPLRTGHLRHRNLGVAALIMGGTIGCVAIGIIYTFDTALLLSFVSVMIACASGGIASGAVFLVLTRWFHHGSRN